LTEGNKGSRKIPAEFLLYELIKKRKPESSLLRLVIWGQQFPQFDGRYIRHICALHDETGNASGFKFAGYSHMHKTKGITGE